VNKGVSGTHRQFVDLMVKHGVKYDTFMGYVGEGWLPLIDELMTKIIALGWDKDLHQVKEKYAGLRFYIGSATEEIHDIISEYERKSLKTCEQCGEPGKVVGTGWLLTLCEECDKESYGSKSPVSS
jgi:hypothetical protein